MHIRIGVAVFVFYILQGSSQDAMKQINDHTKTQCKS